MSDSVVEGSFSGLASKAEAMLAELETAANETQQAAPEEAPVASVQESEQPQTVDPVAAPEAPPLDVSPDTRIRIKVNGEEKIVAAKDYQEMLQRTDVFTQRQQALARQREELEQHYVQREAQIQQHAQYLQQQAQLIQQQGDPVERLVQKLQQNQQASPAPLNPNEIATIGELQAALAAFQQQQQQELMRVQQQTQQEILAAREHARQEQQAEREAYLLRQDQAKITAAVQQVLQTPDGQLLQEINPQAAALIRFNAFQMGPENVEQAQQYINEYTAEWAGKVRGRLAKQSTTGAVQAAKTVMEPPSGTPPSIVQAKPKSALKKDGSTDWALLREQALSLLE